jgi:hypothetical protein
MKCFLKMVRDSYRQVLQTLESLNLETLNKTQSGTFFYELHLHLQ